MQENKYTNLGNYKVSHNNTVHERVFNIQTINYIKIKGLQKHPKLRASHESKEPQGSEAK